MPVIVRHAINLTVSNNNFSYHSNGIDYNLIHTYASMGAIPIFLLGAVANIFILYVIAIYSKFRKRIYNLICVTVISDILSTLICSISYILVVAINVQHLLGRVLCRVLVFIVMTSYGISILTLSAIALDRLQAITKPITFIYWRRKYKIMIISQVLIWTISIAVSSPFLIFIDTYPDEGKFCDFPTITAVNSLFFIILTLCYFVVPSTIFIVSYSKIIKYMKSYTPPGQLNFNQDQSQKKKNFIKMLILITASHLLITWPYFATNIGMAINRYSLRQLRQNHFVYYLLAFFSYATTTAVSVANPFLFLKFDANIRAKSWEIIKRLAIANCCYPSISAVTPITECPVPS
ncbi:rhodopsin [Trichoplax sp. H2]|nr:rhodopsin [Trichoplax sp. H2]|eukprot:RDD39618.1 rhodopsin [Trichoplax sp. H2]